MAVVNWGDSDMLSHFTVGAKMSVFTWLYCVSFGSFSAASFLCYQLLTCKNIPPLLSEPFTSRHRAINILNDSDCSFFFLIMPSHSQLEMPLAKVL